MEALQHYWKHFIDGIMIPVGTASAISVYLNLANHILATFVLLLSAAWGVYRLVDIRDERNHKKELRRRELL